MSLETKSPAALVNDSAAACLVIVAHLEPIADQARFQPAGFPEIGQVSYGPEAKRTCIVDSAASMANHLETVCMTDPNSASLHPDLAGLPHVACVTEEEGTQYTVLTSLTEGHRLASDYFVGPNATLGSEPFRDVLQREMAVKKLSEKKFFFYPESWGTIYKTVFSYDPNSLVHGILFAREQIKISRLLTAHHEALGAKSVPSSGVKFDRLGKTTSGQPIFSVSQQTATDIVATFVFDLALLRSYGRDDKGLNSSQKQLLLELALWKIGRLTSQPFRFRSGCHLQTVEVTAHLDGTPIPVPVANIHGAIDAAGFSADRSPLKVLYPAKELFRIEKEKEKGKEAKGESPEADEDGGGDEE